MYVYAFVINIPVTAVLGQLSITEKHVGFIQSLVFWEGKRLFINLWSSKKKRLFAYPEKELKYTVCTGKDELIIKLIMKHTWQVCILDS